MLEVLREERETRRWFIENNFEFPKAAVQDCPVFFKESVMCKNRSVEYFREPNEFKICRNYIPNK
jgi:hypothetical protein